MQTWFYRLSPIARAVITGAWVFAALFGVTQLAALGTSSAMFPNSVAPRAVMTAIFGVVFGVIGVVLGDRRIRRIYGSTEQAITYSRALRTGQLPADIEPAAWQRWLDVSRQSMRWTPVTVTLFAATCAAELPRPPVGASGASSNIGGVVHRLRAGAASADSAAGGSDRRVKPSSNLLAPEHQLPLMPEEPHPATTAVRVGQSLRSLGRKRTAEAPVGGAY